MNSSEKIKANVTVIIKFIICRNISGYESDKMTCHRRFSIPENVHKENEEGSITCWTAAVVQLYPQLLAVWFHSPPATVLACYLAFGRKANVLIFPLTLLLTMWLSILSLASFLLMYQISYLSCLRDTIILSILAVIQHLQKRSVCSKDESAISIAVQFKELLWH